jgi:hypothetical protein
VIVDTTAAGVQITLNRLGRVVTEIDLAMLVALAPHCAVIAININVPDP